MADGYTTKFNAYAEQVKTEASLNMQDFYTNHLDNYFTCTYSVSNGKGGFTNQTGPGCPPKSEPSKFSGYEWNIYMEPNDINAFYEFVQSTYGIDSSWIIFKEWQYGECLPKQQDCSTFGNIIGQPDADPNLVVPDPKDLIQAGLTNFTLLSAFLSDTAVAVEYYLYWGNSSDVVDAAAMPVFMVENAITNMKNVSAIGENAIQEQRKDLILNIIMAVLMVLPGVGEVLEGVADLTFIARMIEMVADIGNVAQSVYDVVENPSSAPLAVMGLLLGGLGKIGTSDDSVAEAAAVRRGMTEDTISGLGPDVKAAMDKVSSVVQRCSG
jgi:chitinase